VRVRVTVTRAIFGREALRRELKLRSLLAQAGSPELMSVEDRLRITLEAAQEARWWSRRAVRYMRITMTAAIVAGAATAFAGYCVLKLVER
jgi:hypothetical protein